MPCPITVANAHAHINAHVHACHSPPLRAATIMVAINSASSTKYTARRDRSRRLFVSCLRAAGIQVCRRTPLDIISLVLTKSARCSCALQQTRFFVGEPWDPADKIRPDEHNQAKVRSNPTRPWLESASIPEISSYPDCAAVFDSSRAGGCRSTTRGAAAQSGYGVRDGARRVHRDVIEASHSIAG